MSQGHQNDTDNKGQDLQALSGKCFSQFRAKKMAFLVELGEPHQQATCWFYPHFLETQKEVGCYRLSRQV